MMKRRFEIDGVDVQIAVSPSGYVHSVSIITSPEFAANFERTMTAQKMTVCRVPGGRVAAWHTAHHYAMLSADAGLLSRLKAGEVPALTEEQLERYAFLAPKTPLKAVGGAIPHEAAPQARPDTEGAAPALFPEHGKLPNLPILSAEAAKPELAPPRVLPKLPKGQASLFD